MAKFIYRQFGTAAEFKRECLEGSAIAPAFWGGAIALLEEQEINPLTHEVEATPIHDALGWKYTRFVQNIEQPLIAGNFRQADGSTWQLKLSRARLGKKHSRKTGDRKPIKYETPQGNGARAFLPAVPRAIQEVILENHLENNRILDREPVAPEKWWDLVAATPTLPIVPTEGGKTGLSALSHGYAAIALNGIYGGHHRVNPDNPADTTIALNPDLARFAVPGRPVIFAFDQDADPITRQAVATAIARSAPLWLEKGCSVFVAIWNPADGKGLDDLVANCGPGALHRAIAGAVPFKQWRRDRQLAAQRRRHLRALGKFAKHHAGFLSLNVHDLAGAGAEAAKILRSQIPADGIVVIKSRTATGKTNLARVLLAAIDKVIAPGSRESLQRGLAARLGLDYLNDLQRIKGGWLRRDGSGWSSRLAMCMDSIAKIDVQNFQPGTFDLFLDEVDQALFHALLGGTCGKDGKRPKVQAVLVSLIKNARRVILASAGVSEREIALVSEIRGDELPYILDNNYRGGGYAVDFYTDSPEGGDRKLARAAVYTRLLGDLVEGKRIIVHTDTRATSRRIEMMGLMLGLEPAEILRFDGDTSAEALQRKFADAPNVFLASRNIRLLVASPSLTSGVSLTGPDFDRVYGLFEGQSILPADCMQAIARYRHPVPRIVFSAARGRGKALAPINALDYSDKINRRSHYSLAVLGEQDLNLDINTPTARYVASRQTGDHWAMVNFGVSLQAHLENEGHRVAIATLPTEKTVEGTLAFVRQVNQKLCDRKLEDQVNAATLTAEQAEKLRNQKALTYRQRLELDKFDACQFYGISSEEWTREFVERDNGGKYRQGLQLLAEQLLPGVALDDDSQLLARLKSWNEAIAPHDLPNREARRQIFDRSGILNALAEAIRLSEQLDADGRPVGWSILSGWIIDLQAKLKPYRAAIKLLLGITFTGDEDPCKFLGTLIKYLTKGVLKTKKHYKGARGQQIRVYSFTPDSLAIAREFLTRLVERWSETTTATPYAHALSQSLLLSRVCTKFPNQKKSPLIAVQILPKSLIPIGKASDPPPSKPAIA